jgi:TolB-like protein
MMRMTRLIPLAAAVVAFVPAAAQAQGKPTVAIMQFENGSFGKDARDYDGLSKGVPAMLITDMAGNSNIRVIERAEVQKLVDEQKLVTGGHVDAATAVKAGKLLGVHHMIFGTFMTDPKGGFRIDAKAVNVETGEIEHVERVDDKADNIMAAIGTLSSKLNTGLKLPPMTRRTGDAAPASTGAQQAGAPAQQTSAAPAAQPKLPMRVAVLYGKALDAKDKGDKSKATEYFSQVLKEFPSYEPATKEMASIK